MLDKLNDIGINPIVATKLMQKLGVAPEELAVVDIYTMFEDVARFFSKYENASYVISKVTSKYSDNMLQKVYEYVQLQKQRNELEQKVGKLADEMNLIKEIPEASEMYENLTKRKVQDLIELNNVKKELQLYEK